MGYFHIKRSGGLALASSLEAKFEARSPKRKKNLGSSGTTRGKNLDRIPILGSCLKYSKGKIWGTCHF